MKIRKMEEIVLANTSTTARENGLHVIHEESSYYFPTIIQIEPFVYVILEYFRLKTRRRRPLSLSLV